MDALVSEPESESQMVADKLEPYLGDRRHLKRHVMWQRGFSAHNRLLSEVCVRKNLTTPNKVTVTLQTPMAQVVSLPADFQEICSEELSNGSDI